MIKTTNREIQQSTGCINVLLVAKLPAKATYSVSKLAGACMAEQKTFSEATKKVFEEAGCKIVTKKVKVADKDTGGTKEVDSSVWHHDDAAVLASTVATVEEMADAEVEINALPLNIDQFGNAELPGNTFIGLDWAIQGG